jgi:hypothetical protein
MDEEVTVDLSGFKINRSSVNRKFNWESRTIGIFIGSEQKWKFFGKFRFDSK